ncbi:hypothetical protein [Paraburkholderia sp. BCC1884]|uniref:hypothetical protein n=1 Tax=Paraburkholderia sp. BCC1884 TaxID=2562668 RepID=UPI0011843B18|nr:hypothetical protein [Paraburkholderia sp. BCC1884]
MLTTLENDFDNGFLNALRAPARAATIAAADDCYGWMIGTWEMDVLHYRVGLGGVRRRGEIHCGWVLEGRAVQDVWIMPPGDHPDDPAAAHSMYGSTLRIWDPALQAWRVTFVNPATGQRNDLIGRRIGRDLVQIGTRADGTPIRWNFTEITQDSFRWTGVALAQDGVTWTLQAEFQARRSTPVSAR